MKEIYEIAIKAAIEGGKEIMKIYSNKEFEVDFKDDDSPLTIADKKSNEIIHKYLLPLNIPVISEENKQVPFFQREKWDQCWIVDPLDGTKEFIKRNGEFTVNIAFINRNFPVFGVIYVPAKRELYFGDVIQQKSYKYTLNENEEFREDTFKDHEISPSYTGDKIRVVGSRSHMNLETLQYIENLSDKYKKEIELVSIGSSLKFCLIAEGQAQVYPRFAPTMEWDTAAGQAICNAVGLQVIDQETCEPMIYNKKDLLNKHFVVSNFGQIP